VQRFFRFYAMNRHKMTTLARPIASPRSHCGAISCRNR
jgi:hypothetical protein